MLIDDPRSDSDRAHPPRSAHARAFIYRHAPLIWLAALVACGLGLLGISADMPTPEDVTPDVPKGVDPVRFGRDIRPILSDRCFKCHGPDPSSRQADLRLDDRDSATTERKGGAHAIVPGRADQSELWKRITSTDPDEVMPPPKAGKKPLNDQEKELLKHWVDSGAAYEPHWAFVAPKRPASPALKSQGWARNEIDGFIQSTLERHQIKPAPEAERSTLARRVFLDLTGLPPTPEELAEFSNDQRPDAYERLVDRLMNDDPYRTRTAERLAVPWLDSSRFADTSGIHMDAGRQIWLWRDWVLNAYRDNMPFDRFLTEQLAGDLISSATDDQKIASGFNRNHVTTDEGGAIAEEYLVEYAVERTATTGSVFLGLTVGCARCHDHKFDPVSQSEFFSLLSFFNSIEEPGLYSQLPDPQRAFEPFLVVPTAAQKKERAEISALLAASTVKLDESDPKEDSQRAEFFAALPTRSGIAWQNNLVLSVASTSGSTMTVQNDRSVLASGANPDRDEFQISVRAEGTNLRLIALEALGDASMFMSRVGRAPNGNAVLSRIEAEAVSVADPSQRTPIHLTWAWADVEQMNGDYRVTNVIHSDAAVAALKLMDAGWAVAAHEIPGNRLALFQAERPFGFEGGTEVRIKLSFQSIYANHTLGRVRLSLGTMTDQGTASLPVISSAWHQLGPFTPSSKDDAYAREFGPEKDASLDTTKNFAPGKLTWKFLLNLADEKLNYDLPQGLAVTFVGRSLFSPSPRQVEVSLGSDDGFQLFLNGTKVAENKAERSVLADQDKVTLNLVEGENWVVLKVVNTGGPGGFYWRLVPESSALPRDIVAAVGPTSEQTPERAAKLGTAWKLAYSTRYRSLADEISVNIKRIEAIDVAAPKTMVMKELPKPRETFVLKRGDYDKPDKARPVTRAVPALLGKLPENVPHDRLGLSAWLTSAENPLVARVAVNRLWELAFGSGIVRTTEDFGYQGEWPSHPELLDWLAVEFRESGWDVRHMLKLVVTSSTYRQSSRVRGEVVQSDPDNRWLSYFPRKRLSAEQIRDQALYVSGLLVEKLGGPSVKPYQPEGLWAEVAMPESNTRIYERGKGEDLWRRSLYTYWKRAAPPPSLAALDSPTRESCTVRRISTNTPLQALVLWNDEQFVEAARVLAARTLAEPGDDQAKLGRLYQRCTAREPSNLERAALNRTLAHFRERFSQSPEDAAKIIAVGETMKPKDAEAAELAAWTMIASSMLNLDATISKD